MDSLDRDPTDIRALRLGHISAADIETKKAAFSGIGGAPAVREHEEAWGGSIRDRVRANARQLRKAKPMVGIIRVAIFTIVLSSFGMRPFNAGATATVALRRETQMIPIIYVGATDPVAGGIVPRLDRPSGSITGFARFTA
jgi:hypothetical protein